jgi:hypothetical protein
LVSSPDKKIPRISPGDLIKLDIHGFLPERGSLFILGLLYLHDSLVVFGFLSDTDSLAFFGFLIVYGSLPLYGSLVTLWLKTKQRFVPLFRLCQRT